MIQRDGQQKSIWQKTSPRYTSAHKAGKKKVYDVIIIGGGITGVTTAALLQESGLQCMILEARNLCFGTTGGTTAHLNTLLDTPYSQIEKKFNAETARLVADAAKSALELIRKNISRYQISCEHEDCDAFVFSREEKQNKELEDITAACSRVGLSTQSTDQLPVPIPFLRAAKVSGQGKFHPVKYVYGLARAFEQKGGLILQHCRALGVREDQHAEIETSRGNYKSRYVIYASHMPTGVNLLHLRCQPFRSYAMALTLKDKNYPADLCYDLYDPYHYYRTQVIDNKPYLIAGGYDHNTGKEVNTADRFEQLEQHVRTYFKINKKISQWSSQYFEPADGLPYIGRLPGHGDNILVAAGFGGNGMTYSQISALVFRSVILHEDLAFAGVFNPNRIKPVAGFKNFISQNVEAVKNFAGRFMRAPLVEDFSEIGAGEGKIVRYEHEKLAVYKDAARQIHAVKPTCTHLGCEVSWNAAEQSWDCSCHGARYSVDGEVLTVPATQPLEKIEMGQPAVTT